MGDSENDRRRSSVFFSMFEFLTFTVIACLLILSVIGFFTAYTQCFRHQNPFGEQPLFLLLGAFVWGDVVVFSVFWFVTCLVMLVMQWWVLFWVIFSIFWTVRSLGEVQYWLYEQFATQHRNKPADLRLTRWFPGEEVYFVLQIIWQCVAVVAIVSAIILTSLLLRSLPF